MTNLPIHKENGRYFVDVPIVDHNKNVQISEMRILYNPETKITTVTNWYQPTKEGRLFEIIKHDNGLKRIEEGVKLATENGDIPVVDKDKNLLPPNTINHLQNNINAQAYNIMLYANKDAKQTKTGTYE